LPASRPDQGFSEAVVWREGTAALEPLRTYPAFQKLVKELAGTP
jgi:hypothetical protein